MFSYSTASPATETPTTCTEPHTESTRAIQVSFPVADGYRTLSFTDAVQIGRSKSCEVQLDDHRISARHVEIFRVGTLWWVRDLDTTEGTFLDDEFIDVAPVSSTASLQLGDGGLILLLEPERKRMSAVAVQ